MRLSPQVKAGMLSALVLVPVVAGRLAYDDLLSRRAWMYIWLAGCLLMAFVQQWLQHRFAGAPATRTLPVPELSLLRDPVPAIVWSALIPPILLMALLWWVTFHGSSLPWRDSWLAPPQPAATHRLYLHTMIMIVVWSCFSSWVVVYRLARWHGMSRGYPRRRELLVEAVGLQWIALVAIVAWASGSSFYLPAPLATACALVYSAGLFAVIRFGRQVRALRSGEPQTGTWWYFDPRDPTFLGPRGMNLANRWTAALVAAGLMPVVLAEWLYHQARA